jgi:hypothetical protein
MIGERDLDPLVRNYDEAARRSWRIRLRRPRRRGGEGLRSANTEAPVPRFVPVAP